MNINAQPAIIQDRGEVCMCRIYPTSVAVSQFTAVEWSGEETNAVRNIHLSQRMWALNRFTGVLDKKKGPLRGPSKIIRLVGEA